jgi:hypothetical protein
MSSRRVEIVILCEDSQHKVFITRFLKQQNKNYRQIRVVLSEPASGSGEQFVRENYPIELKAYRNISRRLSTSLAVVIDADIKKIEERIKDFDDACRAEGISCRDKKEKVAFIIPKRNIETWLRYLRDEDFDEQEPYNKYKGNESLCAPQVKKLDEMCRDNGLPENAPHSLKLACKEYNERLS